MADPRARAPHGAELRQHLLAQGERELTDQFEHPLGLGRPVGARAQLDLDGAPVALAHDLEGYLVARALGADQVGEVVVPGELAAVHRDDHVAVLRDVALALEVDLVVAGLEPGVVGEAAVLHLRDQRPFSTSSPSRSASCG